MLEYSKKNPYDVFFNHLHEIDPVHYNYLNQNQLQKESTTSTDTKANLPSKPLADPRTGVEIENYFCRYDYVDRTKYNIFLKNRIHVSHLNRIEHLACLQAIRSLSKSQDQLTTTEQSDRLTLESTEKHRTDEKELFLQKIQEHFIAKKSNRCHFVPAAVEYFISQIWKKKLIMLFREYDDNNYKLSTALTLTSHVADIQLKLIHQEHLGKVPGLERGIVCFVQESSVNLIKSYEQRKKSASLIKNKIEQIIDDHRIDYVIPISTLAVILCDDTDWQFRINIEDGGSIFNPKNKITFEKPLPPTYLSGDTRYRKGAKYMLRSQLYKNLSKVFDHSKGKEISIDEKVEINGMQKEDCDKERNYKLYDFDQFMKNYHEKVPVTNETSYENATFAVFEISGCDDDEINDTFRILVPSKQDAFGRNKNGEIEFMRFAPKIERQPEYGCEVMSKNELMYEWCQVAFRPNTVIERGKSIVILKNLLF